VRESRLIFLIIVLALVIGHAALINKSVAGQKISTTKTYTSPNEGFQFRYPSSWGDATGMDGSDCHKSECFTSFVIRDPLSNSIDVFIIRIDSYDLGGTIMKSCNCSTLADFVNWDYDQKFRKDNNILFQNQSKVGGHEAWQMGLVSSTEKQMTQKLLLWTIQGNTGYRIQYSAPAYRFTEYLNNFEDMLNSFAFLEVSEPKKPMCLLFNFICF
jgi:hypothetical protein